MARFPNAIWEFANDFAICQKKRHAAEYDPTKRCRLYEVNVDIGTADVAIQRLEGCTLKDKRAFAAWLIMCKR